MSTEAHLAVRGCRSAGLQAAHQRLDVAPQTGPVSEADVTDLVLRLHDIKVRCVEAAGRSLAAP